MKQGLDEMQLKLLRAKWDHYVDKKLEQFHITTRTLDQEMATAQQHDPWIIPRVEYMYDHLDFRSDRSRCRERFIKQVNKKSTIEDIGGLLDEWILDSKAAMPYWQPGKMLLEQPDQPQRDVTDQDLWWQSTFIGQSNQVKPSWLDDHK